MLKYHRIYSKFRVVDDDVGGIFHAWVSDFPWHFFFAFLSFHVYAMVLYIQVCVRLDDVRAEYTLEWKNRMKRNDEYIRSIRIRIYHLIKAHK